jgi:hypothetical protein
MRTCIEPNPRFRSQRFSSRVDPVQCGSDPNIGNTTPKDVYDVRCLAASSLLQHPSICASHSYKPHPSSLIQNQTQLICNMQHIMREDPCRRFVFGISIEDTQTRVWHANRAGVFINIIIEPFDYVEVCMFYVYRNLCNIKLKSLPLEPRNISRYSRPIDVPR